MVWKQDGVTKTAYGNLVDKTIRKTATLNAEKDIGGQTKGHSEKYIIRA